MSYDETTGLPLRNSAGYVYQHDQYNGFAQRTQTLTTSPQRYYDSRQLEPVLQAFEVMRRAAQADFASYTFPKRERLIAAGITPYSVDDLREAALFNVDWLFDYAWHELLQKLNNFEAYEEEAALVDYLDRYFPNSGFPLSLFEPSEESFDICPPMFSLRSDWEEGGDWICYSRFDYLRTPANKALYSDLKAKLSTLYREHAVDLSALNVAYSANYRYDALGRILHQQQLVGNSLGSFESERHDYRYDEAGRLKTADSWEFEYDANGNRVKSTQDGFLETLATYDTEDRLLSFGNRTYTYDANGARQTQTENGTETRYRYDNLGALKSVTKSGQTIDYITDATGRRVGRKVNGSVESMLIYQDDLHPIAQYNADGSIRWTIVYAERMNVPSLLISSNGTRYRVVSDHLGSVRLIINTLNGQIVQRMDYDVWGKVTDDSNPNFQPFGFAGGLYDSATELVRFGARDYDPHVGRWLSKDPIGFAGGDSNLYGYVLQDPVNLRDPSGLSANFDSSLCSALWKLAAESDNPWIRGDDLYMNDITQETAFLEKLGLPVEVSGVDLQYVLVNHRFVRSTGWAKYPAGIVSSIFLIDYSVIGSSVSAYEYGVNFDGLANDISGDTLGTLIGLEAGWSKSFEDYVSRKCPKQCDQQ